MSMSINTTEKSGLVQQIRSGVVLARKAMIAALSARPGAPVRLGDEANQIELLRMAHHRREEIRRGAEELRLLGVRR